MAESSFEREMTAMYRLRPSLRPSLFSMPPPPTQKMFCGDALMIRFGWCRFMKVERREDLVAGRIGAADMHCKCLSSLYSTGTFEHSPSPFKACSGQHCSAICIAFSIPLCVIAPTLPSLIPDALSLESCTACSIASDCLRLMPILFIITLPSPESEDRGLVETPLEGRRYGSSHWSEKGTFRSRADRQN